MSGNIIESKIDHKTLHFLPFLPSRNRKKKFKVEKKWGEAVCVVKAPESINTYDLITLMFMTKAYLKKNWYAGYIGEGEEKREIAGLEMNLEQICKERGIINKKMNRETILNSLIRLSHVDLFFRYDESEIMTKYIYEIRYDLDYKKAKVYANKRFIEHITRKGILVNLSAFVKLERAKSEGKEYAILLYAFLSGTKTKTQWKGKTLLKWREKYDEELLLDAINLNDTKLTKKRKREELKKAFLLLHAKLGLPLYEYEKHEKSWIRKDFLQKKHSKVK